jgi:hypothetical protein
MVNGDVDGGAPSDLSAGGQRLSERSEGCGVGAAGAADPRGVAGWATAQDRHARADERHLLFAVRWVALALSAPRQFSAPLDRLQHRSSAQIAFGTPSRWNLRKHMALRERMGREASPSAAVLDSQSVKSAEKGAVLTTKWVTTPASR